MIRYQLICDQEHESEGWFASSDAFDAQRKKKLLQCPVCGSHKVDRALMAPSLSSRREPAAAPATFATDPRAAALHAAIRELRDHVTKNADYVGPRFADEARKIHYEEAEARSIYGEASADDARALYEEGVEFHPLPALPDDMN